MDKVCIHCYVKGNVQGVFYRAGAKAEAERLGLTGWTRNLPDGQVEVVACGDEKAIGRYQKWLWHGPKLARVDDIEVIDSSWEEFAGFTIRYD